MRLDEQIQNTLWIFPLKEILLIRKQRTFFILEKLLRWCIIKKPVSNYEICHIGICEDNMKKLNDFLNVIMGSFFGVFVGSTIANYREYRTYPEIYEASSAPWYYHGALTSFILFLAVVIICVLIKLLIRKKAKK